MKNEIIIRLDQVNKINYETMENFEDSVFQEVYENAFRKVELIIEDNQRFVDKSCGKSDEQVDNIISILGKRGAGKTSVMRSFIAALEKYFGKNTSDKEKRQKLQHLSGVSGLKRIDETSFLVLEYIDATLLNEKEGILDVILARMWDKYESICRDVRKDRRQEILETDLREQFEIVRNSYLFQKHTVKGEVNESRELSTLRTLHKLAGSINLRDDFKRLVSLYLQFNCFCGVPEKITDFLIISIDDIDVVSGDVYDYLEQIRRFLTIPQVIVFLTADIHRLKKVCYNNPGLNKFGAKGGIDERLELGDSFVEDYLAKSLPHNSRIYMPELKEESRIHTAVYKIPDKIDGQASIYREEKALILQYMAKYLHLYFDGTRGTRHFLQHTTLRNLINYFQSLIDVIENNMEDAEDSEVNFRRMIKKWDWFKRDVKFRLSGELLPERQREKFQQIFYLEPDEINDELILYIYQYLVLLDKREAEDYYEEYKKYKANYGLILRGCNLIEQKGVKHRAFVNCIIAFYTLIMAEQRAGLYPETFSLPGGMIQGVWRNSQLLFDSRVKREIYFVNSHNLELTGSEKLWIKLNDEKNVGSNQIKSHIEKTLQENRENIIAFQMLMLMHRSVEHEDQYLGWLPVDVSGEVNFFSEDEKNLLFKDNTAAQAAENISQETDTMNCYWLKVNKLNITIVSSRLDDYKFNLLNFVENIYRNFSSEYNRNEEVRLRDKIWLSELAELIYKRITEMLKKENIIVHEENSAFAWSGLEEKFLYEEIIEWDKEFAGQPALPFDHVEFMYELDKKLNRYSMMRSNKDYYQVAEGYYRRIQEELHKQDQYYREILNIETNYEDCFSKCPYIVNFKKYSEKIREIFAEKFRDIENTSSERFKKDEPEM